MNTVLTALAIAFAVIALSSGQLLAADIATSQTASTSIIVGNL